MAKIKQKIVIKDVDWKQQMLPVGNQHGSVIYPFIQGEFHVFHALNLPGRKTKITIEFKD